MPSSAKLEEIRDREVLNCLVAVAANDGYADPEAIAHRLDIRHENPTKCVIQRLAWAKRMGWTDQGDDGRWCLTAEGVGIFSGRLRAAAERALQGLTPGEMMVATSLITREFAQMDAVLAHGVRREWVYNMAARRRMLNGGSR